jgi:hypothetical protein
MKHKLPFYQLDGYPAKVDGPSVVVRLLDSLGFRFHWATHDLAEQDYAFLPGQGCQSIAQLIEHIWGLVNWVSRSICGREETRPETLQEQRVHVLHMLNQLREYVSTLDDQALAAITIRGLPFWHLLNGPLADALTHVGQINVLRRLAGNPTPRASVFTGKPPSDK